MNIIVVDDEGIILEGETNLIRRCAPDATVTAFSSPNAALEYVRTHAVNVVFLDLEMPECHGVVLARRMKALCPHINIIFATAFRDFFETAMELRVSGYLLKPLKAERVLEELNNLRYPVKRYQSGMFVRTFGNFDVYVKDQPVRFKSAKGKELLAYLVDRQGGSVTRAEAVAVLYEDRMYDRPMQKQFDVIIRSLRDTLEENNISEILEMNRGTLRVVPERISCDAWRFFSGDADAVNAYRGEYMSAYSWAEETESFLSQKTDQY